MTCGELIKTEKGRFGSRLLIIEAFNIRGIGRGQGRGDMTFDHQPLPPHTHTRKLRFDPDLGGFINKVREEFQVHCRLPIWQIRDVKAVAANS